MKLRQQDLMRLFWTWPEGKQGFFEAVLFGGGVRRKTVAAEENAGAPNECEEEDG